MKPAFSKYTSAVVERDVTGTFIARATDEELSEVFKEMNVSVTHKVELREAVAAWRADPQRVLIPPCAAAAPAFLPLQFRAHALPSPPPHPSRRCKPSNVKAPLKQSGARLQPRCCFPPLHSRSPIYFFILQAAAASSIKGKPDIIKAAQSGDLSLVRDHVTADPSCVGRRDLDV